MKIAMFAHFKEYHGNHKNFKSLYGFGGRCIKSGDACMDFKPCFNVHNLVSVHPKKHHTWPNDQSQHDLSCGSVSLSIS